MNQQEIFMDALRHVAELCAVAAMTAPKSGGQLFSKGAGLSMYIQGNDHLVA